METSTDGLWSMDPDRLDESFRVMREMSRGRRSGFSVLDPEGHWHLLACSREDGDTVDTWRGEVHGLRISPTIARLCFGFPLPGSGMRLHFRHDTRVDGLVVASGDQPLVALAGPRLSSIPPGLLFLRVSQGTPVDVLSAVLRDALWLRGLEWHRCDAVVDLQMLAGLRELVTLRFVDARLLGSLRGIGRLQSLRNLEISRGAALESLDGLREVPGLRTLRLDSCPCIRDHTVIRSLRSLESLAVTDAGFDVALLRGSSQLRALSLRDVALGRQEAAGHELDLEEHAGLVELDLGGTSWPADAGRLRGLARLRALSLGFNERITRVAALAELPDLRRLCLDGCIRILDFEALGNAPQLRELLYHDQAAASAVLAKCAAARRDSSEIFLNALAWTSDVARAEPPDDLVRSIAAAFATCNGEPWQRQVLIDLVRTARTRTMLDPRGTWRDVFTSLFECEESLFLSVIEAACEHVDDSAGDVSSAAVWAMNRYVVHCADQEPGGAHMGSRCRSRPG